MKKAKYIFFVICIVYLAIGGLSYFGLVNISDNISFGLSFSALSISLCDIFESVARLNYANNEYGFEIQITVNFLEEKFAENAPMNDAHANIRNLKVWLQNSYPKYIKALHPAIYYQSFRNKFFYGLATMCFIVSISMFFAVPFFSFHVKDSITQLLTIIAFAAVSFSLFLGEMTAEATEKSWNFWNNVYPILGTAYPEIDAQYVAILRDYAKYLNM